jgi:hypothetical protein
MLTVRQHPDGRYLLPAGTHQLRYLGADGTQCCLLQDQQQDTALHLQGEARRGATRSPRRKRRERLPWCRPFCNGHRVATLCM